MNVQIFFSNIETKIKKSYYTLFTLYRDKKNEAYLLEHITSLQRYNLFVLYASFILKEKQCHQQSVNYLFLLTNLAFTSLRKSEVHTDMLYYHDAVFCHMYGSLCSIKVFRYGNKSNNTMNNYLHD